MNVLFIAAHPDDLELNAAGTLLKYKNASHKCFIVLTTSGNIGSGIAKSKEEIAGTREAEATESSKFLGAEIKFLRFDDEKLINNENTRDAVLNAIRWANPEVIFTHAPEDNSPDHHTTSQIVQDVMLSLPVKLFNTEFSPCTKQVTLFFWSSGVVLPFNPAVYVDITDVFEDKIKSLKYHKSQYEWMGHFMLHDLLDMPRIIDEFRGLQYGVKYAEAFRAFKIHGYMPNYKLLP